MEKLAGHIVKLKDRDDVNCMNYAYILTNFDSDSEEWEDVVLGLPVSVLGDFLATDSDVIFSKGNKYLHIPFFVMCGIAHNITREMIDWRHITEVDEDDISKILNVHFKEYGAKYDARLYEATHTGEPLDAEDRGIRYMFHCLVEDDIYNANDVIKK